MIISKIEIYRFSIPMQPFTIATGTMEFAQNILVKIYIDNGLVGLGEGSAFPMIVGETQETMLKMAQDFAKIWKGKNPLEITQRMNELNLFVPHHTTCKSAFDMALYDLAAKNANLPLYKFLSGEKRKVITDITVGIDTPSQMAKMASKFVENGATIIKVKLGKNILDDLDRVKQIRAAVGNDVKLRLDANQGWSFDDAVSILNDLEQFDIEFCEQPISSSFDDFLPQLIELSTVKIMVDESCFNHHDARKLIKSKSCDYINIKLAKSGGIHEALKIYEVANMHNIPCMMGGMLESRLALTACLHFALACPKIEFYDMDTCMLGHLIDPIIGGVTFKGYELFVSNDIGIGTDVEPEFLNHCEKFII